MLQHREVPEISALPLHVHQQPLVPGRGQAGTLLHKVMDHNGDATRDPAVAVN